MVVEDSEVIPVRDERCGGGHAAAPDGVHALLDVRMDRPGALAVLGEPARLSGPRQRHRVNREKLIGALGRHLHACRAPVERHMGHRVT
jgi:hypothetical protein